MYRKDINLRKAIGAISKVLDDSISKRNIDIRIDCDNAPEEIRTQESQFHQMLINLVKNSVEAIDELAVSGGLNETPFIEVRCYVESDLFVLKVTDNGIGIEKDDFESILEAGYTTRELGSGLGLHSIANFASQCGGEVYPLSEGIGKGATIRVMLPLSSVTP